MEAASAATMDMKPNVRTSDVHVNRKQARMTAHRSSGLLHRLWVLLTRICLWYSLFHVIFRCPTTTKDLKETHSFVCQPYLQVRDQVVFHLEPYYNNLAKPFVQPYVEAARPYVVRLNNEVVGPVVTVSKEAYGRYGAERVEAARDYAYHYWQRNLESRLDNLKDILRHYYTLFAAPRLARVQAAVEPVTKQILPLLLHAQIFAQKEWRSTVIPAYNRSKPLVRHAYTRTHQYLDRVVRPYAIRVYDASYRYTTAKALPQARSLATRILHFIKIQVWYPIRILYGENVEPQLSKIRERLTSYRDSKKIEAAVEAVDRTGFPDRLPYPLLVASVPSEPIDEPDNSDVMFASVTSESINESDGSVIMNISQAETTSTLERPATATSVHATTGEDVPVAATPEPVTTSKAVSTDTLPEKEAISATNTQINYIMSDAIAYTTVASPVENFQQQSAAHKSALDTRQQVAEDMRIWKEKFAVALGQGAQDLGARVASITLRQITTQADDLGRILILQLEDTTHANLNLLKDSVNSMVQSLSADASSDDENVAQDRIHAAIRSAGRAIKDKAQNLRDWKAHYDEKTFALVKSATESTLDVIDGIRDLGLQEIGLRWTSMKDITYDDWAEYHALKKTFDADRIKVVDSAAKHTGLARAREAGEQVEEAGMQIAEEAAKELVRLKDVALWKIRARDSSDDFESRPVEQAMAFLSEKLKAMVDPSNRHNDVDEVTEETDMSPEDEGQAITEDAIMSITERSEELQEAVSSWLDDDVQSASMSTVILDSSPSETAGHTTSIADFGLTSSPDGRATPAHTSAEVPDPNAGHHKESIDSNEDITIDLSTDENDPPSTPLSQAMPDEIEDSLQAHKIESEAPIHSNMPTLGPSDMTGLAALTDTVVGSASAGVDSLSYDMQKAASEAGGDYAELTRSWMAASAVSTQQVAED